MGDRTHFRLPLPKKNKIRTLVNVRLDKKEKKISKVLPSIWEPRIRFWISLPKKKVIQTLVNVRQ